MCVQVNLRMCKVHIMISTCRGMLRKYQDRLKCDIIPNISVFMPPYIMNIVSDMRYTGTVYSADTRVLIIGSMFNSLQLSVKSSVYISHNTIRPVYSRISYGLIYFCSDSLHSEQGIDVIISKQTENRKYSSNFGTYRGVQNVEKSVL